MILLVRRVFIWRIFLCFFFKDWDRFDSTKNQFWWSNITDSICLVPAWLLCLVPHLAVRYPDRYSMYVTAVIERPSRPSCVIKIGRIAKQGHVYRLWSYLCDKIKCGLAISLVNLCLSVSLWNFVITRRELLRFPNTVATSRLVSSYLSLMTLRSFVISLFIDVAFICSFVVKWRCGYLSSPRLTTLRS